MLPYQKIKSISEIGKYKKIGQFAYSVEGQFPKGCNSHVYKGINLVTSEAVAIKVLGKTGNPQVDSKHRQELGIMEELKSPYLVTCLKLQQSLNNYYVVMERCGEDLQEFMRGSFQAHGSLQSPHFENIIHSIFQGLKYLSQKNIQHRDLKPSNILLKPQQQPGPFCKIADFGHAVQAHTEVQEQGLIGSPHYMAPEALIQHHYSSKTDIWSFGVIIYEMIWGRTPTEDCQTFSELIARVKEGISLQGHPGIDSDLILMLDKCLQPSHYQRWSISQLQNCPYLQRIAPKTTSQQIGEKLVRNGNKEILPKGKWRNRQQGSIARQKHRLSLSPSVRLGGFQGVKGVKGSPGKGLRVRVENPEECQFERKLRVPRFTDDYDCSMLLGLNEQAEAGTRYNDPNDTKMETMEYWNKKISLRR